jgi:hypothetical protein
MVDRAQITQVTNEKAYRGANHETYTGRGVNTRDLNNLRGVNHETDAFRGVIHEDLHLPWG